MESKKRRIITIGSCLICAIGMFFLGVVTERRWAANRLNADSRQQLEQIISGSAEQEQEMEQEATIRINELGFPEALQSGRQLGDEPLLAPSQTPGPQPGADEAGGATASAPPLPSTSEPPGTTAGADHNFFIQLGAFKSSENARKAVSLFHERGFGAKVVKRNDPNHGLRFTVRMGPFDDRSEASVTLAELKRQNIPHFLVYPSV